MGRRNARANGVKCQMFPFQCQTFPLQQCKKVKDDEALLFILPAYHTAQWRCQVVSRLHSNESDHGSSLCLEPRSRHVNRLLLIVFQVPVPSFPDSPLIFWIGWRLNASRLKYKTHGNVRRQLGSGALGLY